GERRKQVLSIAARVYASIEDTTDIAIAFNDKYDEYDHSLDFTNLQNDLAMLGEAMSNRADYEDQLIDSLLH
ncbi:MAG TPA: Rsd/AlgQ family anti-sigma factor, partial [Gammaproteobacteria bacterium]|nr:Rsd/AlgQ family anti-sigma factor [Gammaproteobacteria bacterium]